MQSIVNQRTHHLDPDASWAVTMLSAWQHAFAFFLCEVRLLEPDQVLWVLLRIVVSDVDRLVAVCGGIVKNMPERSPHAGHDLTVVTLATVAGEHAHQKHLLHAPVIRRRVRCAGRVARVLCKVNAGTVNDSILASKTSVEALLDDVNVLYS